MLDKEDLEWNLILRKNFTHLSLLLDFLEIEASKRSFFQNHSFKLNLSRRLAEKISKNNLLDPLLKQFVPTSHEHETVTGFCIDPLAEKEALKTSCLIHKYQGRVLLLTSSVCPINCRFCFRKYFDYPHPTSWDKEIEYLQANPSIEEVILSGADPLSMSSQALAKLIEALETVAHIKRLRIHTRFPIAIPERINQPLIDSFSKTRFQVYCVLHINHPKELDQDVWKALDKLKKIPIVLLQQGVLLKGVNDDYQTLYELYSALINQGIIPYYLHSLDPVTGIHHFQVEPELGIALLDQLRSTLPGYAIPQYVQEIAYLPYKSMVSTLLSQKLYAQKRETSTLNDSFSVLYRINQ